MHNIENNKSLHHNGCAIYVFTCFVYVPVLAIQVLHREKRVVYRYHVTNHRQILFCDYMIPQFCCSSECKISGRKISDQHKWT